MAWLWLIRVLGVVSTAIVTAGLVGAAVSDVQRLTSDVFVVVWWLAEFLHERLRRD